MLIKVFIKWSIPARQGTKLNLLQGIIDLGHSKCRLLIKLHIRRNHRLHLEPKRTNHNKQNADKQRETTNKHRIGLANSFQVGHIVLKEIFLVLAHGGPAFRH